MSNQNLIFRKENGVMVLKNPIILRTIEEIGDLFSKYAQSFIDQIRHSTTWQIWRYKNEDCYLNSRAWKNPFADCFDYSVIHGNLILNEGAEVMWNALTGLAAHTVFSNANARTGVGDSSTAAADTQTDLLGSNKSYKAMDGGFPVLSGTGNDTVEFQSVYNDNEGEHAWNEFVVDNGGGAGKTLNRKVSSQGTKGDAQVWTLKVSIQLT